MQLVGSGVPLGERTAIDHEIGSRDVYCESSEVKNSVARVTSSGDAAGLSGIIASTRSIKSCHRKDRYASAYAPRRGKSNSNEYSCWHTLLPPVMMGTFPLSRPMSNLLYLYGSPVILTVVESGCRSLGSSKNAWHALGVWYPYADHVETSDSRQIATPSPPPIHIVARPLLASRRAISCNSVMTTRLPDPANG